jgi:hypothetical protein
MSASIATRLSNNKYLLRCMSLEMATAFWRPQVLSVARGTTDITRRSGTSPNEPERTYDRSLRFCSQAQYDGPAEQITILIKLLIKRMRFY